MAEEGEGKGEEHPVHTEDHHHDTTSEQERTPGQRREAPPRPFGTAQQGRLTARELARRRRQRLQQLLQQPALPQAEEGVHGEALST
jgi:hypothetical protein